MAAKISAMRPGVDSERTCSRTNLSLVASAGRLVYRVARKDIGPLSPRSRPTGGPRDNWSRYDIPRRKTVYCGSTFIGAYTEAMYWAKQPLPEIIHTLALELEKSGDEFCREVALQWTKSHMSPHCLSAGWRERRKLYTLKLPSKGWFVDVSASGTVAAIRNGIGSGSRSMSGITLGDISGDNRGVTTGIAERLAVTKLDDGTLPLGVRFQSKHGADLECWAIWLPPAGSKVAAPKDIGEGFSIPNAVASKDVEFVCKSLGIRIH